MLEFVVQALGCAAAETKLLADLFRSEVVQVCALFA